MFRCFLQQECRLNFQLSLRNNLLSCPFIVHLLFIGLQYITLLAKRWNLIKYHKCIWYLIHVGISKTFWRHYKSPISMTHSLIKQSTDCCNQNGSHKLLFFISMCCSKICEWITSQTRTRCYHLKPNVYTAVRIVL